MDPFVPELMKAEDSTKDKDARRFVRGLLGYYVLKLEDGLELRGQLVNADS